MNPIEKQVLVYLEKLKPGKVVEVLNVAPNHPERFIGIVKQCIDIGVQVEFSDDYKRFKKIDTWEGNIINYGEELKKKINESRT